MQERRDGLVPLTNDEVRGRSYNPGDWRNGVDPST